MSRQTHKTKPSVLIIGAGIGGLTAAIALAQRGFEAHVFERAPALRAAGAGLTVQINAMKVFEALGMAQDVHKGGMVATAGALRDERGRIIAATALGDMAQRWGAPMVGIHRAVLMRILEERAHRHGVHIHTSMAFERFTEDNAGVTAHFESGRHHRGDALIGCDGLWSAVRKSLFGDAPTRYAGYTTWRGIAPRSPKPVFYEDWGPGARFGQVAIAHDQTYWYAVADAPQGAKDGDDVKGELMARFGHWAPDVREVLEATPEAAIMRTDSIDRSPIQTWGRGRVTLLGDAAHPMTPNMGQGACQAIEDALALALALEAHADPSEGLRYYETTRRQRANWFVNQSWGVGRMAHSVKATALRRCRDAIMRWTPQSLMDKTMARIANGGPV